MAKTITVPKEFGSPYVKVWLNGTEYTVYTGKEVSVGDAIYEILVHMMDREKAHEDTSSENYRVKFTTDGTNVMCNRSYDDVFAKAISGANVIAEYEESGTIYVMRDALIKKSGSQISFSCTTAVNSGIKHIIIHYYNTGECKAATYSVSG